MRDNILKAILFIVVIIGSVALTQLIKTASNHNVKITYTIGGAERIYIVKQGNIVTQDNCITFTDDLGYQHNVCGTFETQIIN